jgi:hypothetical protein
MIGYELEASATSGRASAKGETTGHATGHTSFLGPSFGRFVLGVLFLALVLGVLVPGLLASVLSLLVFSFLAFYPRSWSGRPLHGRQWPILVAELVF